MPPLRDGAELMVVYAEEIVCTRCPDRAPGAEPSRGPADCFPVSGRRKDGSVRRKRWCYECCRDYDKRWREENDERLRMIRRKRYARAMLDPERRRRQAEYHRRYMLRQRRTPEGLARQREVGRRSQQKLRSDAAYVAARNERRRERRRELKATDPEGYARLLERERQKRLRERARRAASPAPGLVSAAPVREFIPALVGLAGTLNAAAAAAGIDEATLRRIRDGRQARLHADAADAIFTSAGRPDLFVANYS